MNRSIRGIELYTVAMYFEFLGRLKTGERNWKKMYSTWNFFLFSKTSGRWISTSLETLTPERLSKDFCFTFRSAWLINLKFFDDTRNEIGEWLLHLNGRDRSCRYTIILKHLKTFQTVHCCFDADKRKFDSQQKLTPIDRNRSCAKTICSLWF